MDGTTSSQGALTKATLTGTVLQVIMVVLGHYVPAIAQSYPIVGTLIGGITGFLFGKWAGRPGRGASASGGALAGGVAGLLGSAVSYGLGDVPGQTIGVATLSTIVAGLIGGAVGHRK